MQLVFKISIFLILLTYNYAFSKTILLDGKSLTGRELDQFRKGAKVRVSKEALEKVKQSHAILMEGAKSGQKIYGLTVGVGLNKDQKIIDPSGKISLDVLKISTEFNKSLLRAHSVGLGKKVSYDVIRAVMANRLNTLLYGASGISPAAVQLLIDMLNYDIVPECFPSIGSIGEADITILGHLGMSMIGEGKVWHNGKIVKALDAFKTYKISPLQPVAKDALAIISSNAYSSTIASLAFIELKKLEDVQKYVYALSLEALNGNVTPFLADTVAIRPFPSLKQTAKDLRQILDGSYLWTKQLSKSRALQDPLSFRVVVHHYASFNWSLEAFGRLLSTQLNSSDDNPAAIAKKVGKASNYIEQSIFVSKNDQEGVVVPTANFDPFPWVLELEKIAIVLSHLSNSSAMRILRLVDPSLTSLPRFLGTGKNVHAFGAVQKPVVMLSTKNQQLALPISMKTQAIAGTIEDISTNAPEVVYKIEQMIENYYYLLSFELIHNSQALYIRLKENPRLPLGHKTKSLYSKFRKIVKGMERDRPLTQDVYKTYQFLRSIKISEL